MITQNAYLSSDSERLFEPNLSDKPENSEAVMRRCYTKIHTKNEQNRLRRKTPLREFARASDHTSLHVLLIKQVQDYLMTPLPISLPPSI